MHGEPQASSVSVIIAVFNGVETLQQCIDSVARQTYPQKELIIIDGGSNDGTVELLKANDDKISYWISEPDRGIYHAWNKALRKASGDWICFLGADDYFWDENVLVKLAATLEMLSPEVRVAYAQIMLVGKQGEQLYLIGEPWESIKSRFRDCMCIPHPGTMHRRALFERHGTFDDSFQIAGDYEMLLRELKSADAVFVPDVVAVGMRQGAGKSSGPAATLLSLQETRRAQRMHGQGAPSLTWVVSMGKVYVRLLLWHVFGERVARKTLDLGRRIMGRPAHWTKT
jgi:glycosyltransferase involved in cell wall biosynthesis